MDEQVTQLIDIPSLLFSTLWIIGFSIILAALSLQHYHAQISNQSLRERLQHPSFQLPLWCGLSLATIGFAGNSLALWEMITWIGIAFLCGYQLFQSIQDRRKLSNIE